MDHYSWSEKIGDQEIQMVAILFRWVARTGSNHRHTYVLMDFKTGLTTFYQTGVGRLPLAVVFLADIHRQQTYTSKVKNIYTKLRVSGFGVNFTVIGSRYISFPIILTCHALLVVIRLTKAVINDLGIGTTLFLKWTIRTKTIWQCLMAPTCIFVSFNVSQ